MGAKIGAVRAEISARIEWVFARREKAYEIIVNSVVTVGD